MVGLVTGNTEAAAHVKLHRARLNRFFSFGGYGSDSNERGEVTRIALKRASLVYGDEVEPDQAIAVGDTPLDVKGAHAAGIECLGVGSLQVQRRAARRGRCRLRGLLARGRPAVLSQRASGQIGCAQRVRLAEKRQQDEEDEARQIAVEAARSDPRGCRLGRRTPPRRAPPAGPTVRLALPAAALPASRGLPSTRSPVARRGLRRSPCRRDRRGPGSSAGARCPRRGGQPLPQSHPLVPRSPFP